MTKQTFTTGQVLTAAQMTSLQQTAMGGGSTTAKTTSYVLVAADAGTVVQMNAAGATTITVNTALFAAGDTVQIQNVGAGACTITAGTATVSTSATLVLKQYDSGTLYFNTTSAAFFFAVDAADTPLTTTGDIIYSSSGSTAARLGIGTTSQVLTVAGGIPAWATPVSGGMTLLSTTTLTGASVSITSISGSYTNLFLNIINLYDSVNDSVVYARFNSDAGSNYGFGGAAVATTSFNAITGSATDKIALLDSVGSTATQNQYGAATLSVYRYTDTGTINFFGTRYARKNDGSLNAGSLMGQYKSSAAITSLQLLPATGNFSGGTAYLYGVI